MKLRADSLLVRLGLASEKKEAEALILAGKVFIPGKSNPIKPGTLLDTGTQLRIKRDISAGDYASFGGMKLADAMARFRLEAGGKVALDVGSSNGGFTDCLLRAGALRVYAVDVGYGLLDWKLRQDDRVILLERENIRYLETRKIPEKIDLAVIDVSFISVKKVIPPVINFLAPDALMIILIKPAFELPAHDVPPGGIIRDRQKHQKILLDLGLFLENHHFTVVGFHRSLKKRATKNDEFFCYVRMKTLGQPVSLEDLVHEAI
jgi:23S rRNA (cytidine1920-2'-O)/16S rRNA (cytidine1409-2'-O)-methyltransferase